MEILGIIVVSKLVGEMAKDKAWVRTTLQMVNKKSADVPSTTKPNPKVQISKPRIRGRNCIWLLNPQVPLIWNFTDVTLLSGDEKHPAAHSVILAVTNP